MQKKTYLVAYCVTPNNGSRDWGSFYLPLQCSAGSARPFRSLWVVQTARPLDELRNRLARHLGPGEKLFIVECAPHAAWAGLEPGMDEWLSAKFGKSTRAERLRPSHLRAARVAGARA